MQAPYAAALAEARRAWPDIDLADVIFARHLESKTGGGSELDAVRSADLFMACACAQQDPVAIGLFEAAYFDEIDRVCARFPSLRITRDDLVQRLREKLFVVDPPSIASYSGRGDLRAWFRAAVLHLVLNVTSRESRETPTRDCFFEAILDASPSAEAAFLRRACRREFEEAFVHALGAISSRDRSLLRYAFHDRRTIDEVGAVFQVHRATAARWIQKAQLRLVEETRRGLAERLAISDDDADSIVRGAISSLGTTLLRYMVADGAPGP